MSSVISDSSPLINLAGIGRLNLLREMFHEITIPPAVWDEIVIAGESLPGAAEVRTAARDGWIRKERPDNTPLVDLLCQTLHKGEAEAIALALEHKSSLILLDETDARQAAAMFGQRKTGVVGILMKARKEGKIESLESELNTLTERMGFYIDNQLYLKALDVVGEKQKDS